MKLFYSVNSPYARIARIAARESGIFDEITEIPSKNREPDNPVLEYSPVGRVPTLVDGDLIITETKNIYRYIAQKSGKWAMSAPMIFDWSEYAQEGQIIGFLDGIACWVRENRREPKTRSSFLIQVEHDRSKRCLEYLEQEAISGNVGEFPVFRWIALATALGLMDFHKFHPRWEIQYPELKRWFDNMSNCTSMQETMPS
jgi:glutathione S-transferase